MLKSIPGALSSAPHSQPLRLKDAPRANHVPELASFVIFLTTSDEFMVQFESVVGGPRPAGGGGRGESLFQSKGGWH